MGGLANLRNCSALKTVPISGIDISAVSVICPSVVGGIKRICPFQEPSEPHGIWRIQDDKVGMGKMGRSMLDFIKPTQAVKQEQCASRGRINGQPA